MVQYYEVVAPAELGGAPVKDGKSLSSKLVGRLSIGTIVSEEERLGERMRLKKVSGSGPEGGWVSVGLMVQIDAASVQERRQVAPYQGRSMLAAAEAQVEQEGAASALASGRARGKDGAALVLVAVALLTQGLPDAALEASLEALTLLRGAGSKDGEASAMLLGAVARLAKDDTKQALRDALAALELFRAAGDRQMEASALSTIANIRLSLHDANAALSVAKEALAIFRELGDRQGEAAAELTVTDAYVAKDGADAARSAVASDKVAAHAARGDTANAARSLLAAAAVAASGSGAGLEEAERLAAEAVGKARSSGDRALLSDALVQASSIQILGGKVAGEALKLAQEALDVSLALCDTPRQAAALTALSRAELAKGDVGAAVERASEAEGRCGEDDLRGRARALQAMASARLAAGEARLAVEAVDAAVALCRQLGEKQAEADTLLVGVRAHSSQEGANAADSALTMAKDALAIYQLLGHRRGEAIAFQMIASMKLKAPGCVMEALTAAERARSTFLMLGDKRCQGLASHTVAQGNIMLGEFEFGLQTAMQAVVLARQSGDGFGEASALHTAAHAVLRMGRYPEALRVAQEVQALFKKLGAKDMQRVAEHMVAKIQEGIPSRGPGPRTYMQPHENAMLLGQESTPFEEHPTCVVWSVPVNSQLYIMYCLELLKLVDDLKTQASDTAILVTTQGVMARQLGQEMPATWLAVSASTVWALVRTVRLESPRLKISTVDLPPGASPHEITECLRSAQISSGPRNEVAFFLDRRNRMKSNQVF